MSSGAYFAVQLSTIFSSAVRGVGVVAGGPYWCARGSSSNQFACMSGFQLGIGTGTNTASAAGMVAGVQEQADAGLIEPASNIAAQRVYFFSGLLYIFGFARMRFFKYLRTCLFVFRLLAIRVFLSYLVLFMCFCVVFGGVIVRPT